MLRRPLYLTALALVLLTSGCADDTGSAEFGQAEQHYKEGKFKESGLVLLSLLQENPEHASARGLLGQINLAMGYPRAAEKELGTALKLGNKEPIVLQDFLISILWQRRFEDALAELDKAPAGILPESYAQSIRGEALLGLQRTDEAEQAYKAAIAADENNADANRGLVLIALQRNQYIEARKLIATALERVPDDVQGLVLFGEMLMSEQRFAEATKTFNDVLQLQPKSNLARFGLVRAHLAQGQTAEAREAMDGVSRQARVSFDGRVLNGFVALAENNIDAARLESDEILKVKHDHGQALYLAGRVHIRKGNLEQAEKSLSRALSTRPTNFTAISKLLAAVQLRLGELAKARDTLGTALSASPYDTTLMSSLASVMSQLGDDDAALVLLIRATKVNPNSAPLKVQLSGTRLALGQAVELSDLTQLVGDSEQGTAAAEQLIAGALRGNDTAQAETLARKLLETHREDPQAHYAFGFVLEQSGKTAEAQAAYTEALSLQANHTGSGLRLANLHRSAGKHSEAAKVLEALVDKLSTGSKSWQTVSTILADTLRDAGQIEEAEKRYQFVLGAEPESARARTGLARILGAKGNTTKAIDMLEDLRRSKPNEIEGRMVLQMVYEREGRFAEAMAVVDEVLAITPKLYAARLRRAELYMLLGEALKAQQAFTALANDYPDNAEVRVGLGRAQAMFDETRERAGESFASAVERDPTNVEARYQHAAEALRTGRAPTEIVEQARAIQRDAPESMLGWLLEGDALMSDKQYQVAVAPYREALKRVTNTLTYSRVANALRMAGNKTEANAELRAALKISPHDSRLRTLLAYWLDQDGDRKTATEEYEKALSYQPDNVVALTNLGEIMAATDSRKALAMLEKAHEAAPHKTDVARTFASVLLGAGNNERALRVLQRAVADAPEDLDLRYELAVTLARSGDLERSRVELRKALETNRPFSSRADAEALLKELGS